MTDLYVRPATAADKPAVVAFTQHTWAHGDYIHEVYDLWLVDPRGPLLVVEEAGEVVAVSKVTFLGPCQAWLEGLRVHPSHRGRGIARRFLACQFALARERGARTVRLATAWNNYPIHKLAAEQGMSHVATFMSFVAEAEAGTVHARVLAPGDLDLAWAYVLASDVQRRGGGLYDLGWVWKGLDREEVAESIQNGLVSGWHTPAGDKPLAGLAIVSPDIYDQDVLRASWVGGAPFDVAVWARDLRHVAAARGLQSVYTMVVDWPELRSAFIAAGYKSDLGDGEPNLWVFAKEL